MSVSGPSAKLRAEQDATKPTTNSSESTAASPTMVETLTFTTKINAGIAPSIALMPIDKATQLTGASLAFAWWRQDMHEVIVGLGMPTVRAPEGDAKKPLGFSTIASAHGTAARGRPLKLCSKRCSLRLSARIDTCALTASLGG